MFLVDETSETNPGGLTKTGKREVDPSFMVKGHVLPKVNEQVTEETPSYQDKLCGLTWPHNCKSIS